MSVASDAGTLTAEPTTAARSAPAVGRYDELVSFVRERTWSPAGPGGTLEDRLVTAIRRRFHGGGGTVTPTPDATGCSAVVDGEIAVVTVSGAQLNDSRLVRSWLRSTAQRYPSLLVCGLNVTERRRDTWRSMQRNFARSHLDADEVAFVDLGREPRAAPETRSGHWLPDPRLFVAMALVVISAAVVGLVVDANAAAAQLGVATVVGAGAIYIIALSVACYVALGA